jgi:serine/threonine protein kinase
VAFWLLTGRPPFDAADAMSLLAQHSTLEPPAPSTLAPAPIVADLDALVLECLSKDPADRPASADILAERLDGLPVQPAWSPRRAREWWRQHEPGLVDSV